MDTRKVPASQRMSPGNSNVIVLPLPGACMDAATTDRRAPRPVRRWGSNGDFVTLLSHAVRSLHSRPALRHDLVKAGLARAGEYTWRGITEIHLKLMAMADAVHPEQQAGGGGAF